MASMSSQSNFALAVQHFNTGRLAEADVICRQIVAAQPNNADALNLLGLIAGQLGRGQESVDFLRRAMAANPREPAYAQNLGLYFLAQRQFDEAIAMGRRAVAINPNSAATHGTLGYILQQAKRTDEAVASLRQALKLRPEYPEALNNLGSALMDKGLLDEAREALRKALKINPDSIEARNNLGNLLQLLGRYDEAISTYRKALAIRPNFAEAHCALGLALEKVGQIDEALAEFRRAIAAKPDMAQPYYSMAVIHEGRRELPQALDALRRAAQLKPDFAEAHSHLGNALMSSGELDEALACFRRSVEIMQDPFIAGNVPYLIHFMPGCDGPKIAEENRKWNDIYVRPLASMRFRTYSNDCSPDRPLRIGYVSPDIRNHPVGRFFLPLLAHHDRSVIEPYIYHDTIHFDAVTERARAAAAAWRDSTPLSDMKLAEQVREDRIDIFVDLTMRMASNRMLCFALKPAPVQVTYLAYCSTTGLEEMDYRLSDPYLDPPNRDERWYSEKTVRLPRTYWCYAPAEEAPLPGPLPALENHFITFGSFNAYSKVTPPTWQVWCEILRQVPRSKLLVHAPPGRHRGKAYDILRSYGLDPKRLTFLPSTGTIEYFQQYQQIDLALDPFPYTGGTTTCDALWMGVPVVSLAGDLAVTRGGLSILSNLGLQELVADSPAKYVQIAVSLANNTHILSELRATLRQRMASSPLMNPTQFARDVEAAYRLMWREWCAKPNTRP